MKTRVIAIFICFSLVLATWSCDVSRRSNFAETEYPIPIGTDTANVTPPTAIQTRVSEDITPTSLMYLNYQPVDLSCVKYFETQWGNGPGEFGDRRSFYDQNIILGPEPPFFDDQGSLFLPDPANNRVLRFDDGVVSRSIPIPSSYVLDYGGSKIYWTNAQLTGDRLFLIFYYNNENKVGVKLAVLTIEGKEEEVLELDSFSTPSFNFSPNVIVDRRGNIFLLMEPTGVLHYTSTLKSEWITLGNNWPYGETVIGWDGNLYTYIRQDNQLKNWGDSIFDHISNRKPDFSLEDVFAPIHNVSVTSEHILGISRDGFYYLSFRDQHENLWIIRLASASKQGEIAKAPVEWLGRTTSIAISATGSLYGLIIDRENIETNPKIVMCDFPAK